MGRIWLVLGALSGGVAVGLSAWASHGLSPEQARLASSALTMQGWHALALLAGVGRTHAGIAEQARRGIDLVVQIERRADGSRRVVEVVEVAE